MNSCKMKMEKVKITKWKEEEANEIINKEFKMHNIHVNKIWINKKKLIQLNIFKNVNKIMNDFKIKMTIMETSINWEIVWAEINIMEKFNLMVVILD